MTTDSNFRFETSGADDSRTEIRHGKPTFELQKIRSGELLSNLIHKIGHEIGNPLTAIISLASIIERFNAQIDAHSSAAALPPEKISSYSVSIGDEAWRISELSERLVMLLSLKGGNIEPCDLNRLVERTLKKLKLRKRGRRFDVQIINNSPTPPAALADPEQLQILIAELVSNADFAASQKVASSAESSHQVTMILEQNEKQAVITVSNRTNTACPFELATLCDPFVTEFSDQKHLGIGLTMAKAIVERFGGGLEFREQKVGEDFVFSTTVRIPASEE